MQNNNTRERENNHQSSSSHNMVMNMREKEKYIESFNFPFCDVTTKYEKVAKIGQGTFG